MRVIFSLFFSLLLSAQLVAQQQVNFSRADVLSDLKTLRESLIDAHYNVFMYTTESAFDSTYLRVKSKVTQDSLNFLETNNLFQEFTSSVMNGHTFINFPIQSYVEYLQSNGTLFPLEIAFEDNKPLIRKNWSNNKNIPIGSELVSINDQSFPEVLKKIHLLISAERSYFKNVKIETFSFPRFYWQVYGMQEKFSVEIMQNGIVKEYSFDAIHGMNDYEGLREEVLNAKKDLKFFENAAYLNPGSFSGDETKHQGFIDSAFIEINKKKSKNLILDLRNNPGGDDSFSDYLVSYFADKPFKWNSSFTLKTSKLLKEFIAKNYDVTEKFWKTALEKRDGEIYEYNFAEYKPQPENKRFKGKVYVLINRQSHSQSAVTAAQIQDYNFGIIVGEETGDYASLLASIFQFPLPKTGIPVYISKGYIVRVNGSKKEQGVIPDIFIKDFLLDENDEILNGILAKINQL